MAQESLAHTALRNPQAIASSSLQVLLTVAPAITIIEMELYYPIQSSWPSFPASHLFLASDSATPLNYVQWNETPESHRFSADLPGVRKEEIRVEVEDSRYMVIRTEWRDDDGLGEPAERERRGFVRKFRLPEMVDVDGITAAYEDGVLTVTVPRLASRRRLQLDVEDLAGASHAVARAA